MEGRSMASDAAKEGFTGHERDHEVGLDYMVARRYDPTLGRFMSVDPMADEYPGLNPYHYVMNNPLIYLDPTGMCAESGVEGPDKPSECVQKDVVEPIKIMDFSMSMDFSMLFGVIQDLASQVVEGLENTSEKVDEAVEAASETAETGVGIGIWAADHVSTASDIALPAAFMFGPKTLAAVGSVGTIADGVSLGLKTIDYVYFEGSPEAVQAQVVKFSFNFGKVEGLKKVKQFQN